MLNKFALSTGIAVLFASVAGAQSTGTAQQPPQTPPPTAMTHQAETTTVEGCVYREQDIPGRSPNVAERAGVLEDYILVASASPTAAQGTVGTSGTTGTAVATTAMKPKMFKLEHMADDKLSAMVGKRVQVTGKADVDHSDKTATGAPAKDKGMGPDEIEIPEFEVTSIKEVAGECPAKPIDRK